MENPVDILSHHNGVIWMNDLFKNLYFFDTFKGYFTENGYADWNIVFEIDQYMNSVVAFRSKGSAAYGLFGAFNHEKNTY